MRGAEGCEAYPQHLDSQKKPEAAAEMHCLRALERVQILGQAFAHDSGATGSVSQTEMILDLKKRKKEKDSKSSLLRVNICTNDCNGRAI